MSDYNARSSGSSGGSMGLCPRCGFKMNNYAIGSLGGGYREPSNSQSSPYSASAKSYSAKPAGKYK